MGKRETAAATAATVGFLHLHEIVIRVHADKFTGLRADAERAEQVAGLVIGHLGLAVAPGRAGLHLEHIHEESVDVHRLLGELIDGVAVLVGHFARHLGPQGPDGFRTGRAGRDDEIEGAFLQYVHVVHDHLFETFKVAGREGGNAATGIVGRQIDADFVVVEHFEAGFGNVGEDLVAHAAGEEGHLAAAFPGGGVHRADLGAEGLLGEGLHVAFAEERTQQRGTRGGALRVVVVAHGQPLERSADLQQEAEQFRIRQQGAEDGLLEGRKAFIGRNDGAGLHEDFQNGNAGRAVRLTGAAQEATIEFFVDRVRVLNETVSQFFQQRELSAGHVGFHHGFAENGTHGLAHAAFHAGGELVVKRHEGVGEKGQLIHDLNSNQLAGVEQALRVDGLAQAARVPDGAA